MNDCLVNEYRHQEDGFSGDYQADDFQIVHSIYTRLPDGRNGNRIRIFDFTIDRNVEELTRMLTESPSDQLTLHSH
jgi:hypothetical protein